MVRASLWLLPAALLAAAIGCAGSAQRDGNQNASSDMIFSPGGSEAARPGEAAVPFEHAPIVKAGDAAPSPPAAKRGRSENPPATQAPSTAATAAARPGEADTAGHPSAAPRKEQAPNRSAASDSPWTVDDLVNRPRATDAAISPDGGRVAYVLVTPDFAENRYQSDVYVADAATGESLRLTSHEAEDQKPIWSPDGAEIAFLSKRSGSSQLWVISVAGGEARPLTSLDGPVSAPVWSPDGTKIAFLSPAKQGKEEPAEKGRDMKVITALEDRDSWNHIWVLDIGRNESWQVTSEPFAYEDLAWAPDSQSLAFTFDEKGSRSVSEDSHVGAIGIGGGPIRRISRENEPVYAGAPAWSHDGRKIAYFRDREKDLGAYLNTKDIYVLDLESGERVCATAGARLSAGGFGATPHQAPIWSPDDRYLYILGSRGPYQNIYRVPSTGGPWRRCPACLARFTRLRSAATASAWRS